MVGLWVWPRGSLMTHVLFIVLILLQLALLFVVAAAVAEPEADPLVYLRSNVLGMPTMYNTWGVNNWGLNTWGVNPWLNTRTIIPSAVSLVKREAEAEPEAEADPWLVYNNMLAANPLWARTYMTTPYMTTAAALPWYNNVWGLNRIVKRDATWARNSWGRNSWGNKRWGVNKNIWGNRRSSWGVNKSWRGINRWGVKNW